MTLNTLLQDPPFWNALVWQAGWVLACVGFGFGLRRGLFMALPQGLDGALGLAFLCVLGGFCNLLHAVNGVLIQSLWVSGVGLVLLQLTLALPYRGFKQTHSNLLSLKHFDWKWHLLLIILCGLLAAQFGFRSRTLEYAYVDDYQAYLVQPAKMLQKGWLGLEPFSERRLDASLGGKIWLDGLVLFRCGFKGIWGVDNAMGLALWFITLAGLAQVRGLSRVAMMALLGFVLLISPPAVNVTAVTLAIPLLLALDACLSETLTWRTLIGASLLMAGLFSLKNTLAPFGLALWGLHGFRAMIAGSKGKWIFPLWHALCLPLALLFNFPWMWLSHQASGTWWFPYLGKGWHASVYHNGFEALQWVNPFGPAGGRLLGDLLRNPDYGLLACIALYGMGRVVQKIRSHEVWAQEKLWVFPLASLCGLIALLLQQASPLGDRYAFAGVMAALCGAMLTAFEQKWKWGWLAIGLLMGHQWAPDRASLYHALLLHPLRTTKNIAHRADGPLVPDSDIERYQAAQATLEPGAIVLDRTLRPFLWDFKRQEIWIADCPGSPSPPPGMPIGKGWKALHAYLIAQQVRYLAYDYASEAGLHVAQNLPEIMLPKTHPWVKSLFITSMKVQSDFEGMALHFSKTFQDSAMWILDLSRPLQVDSSAGA